MPLLEPPRLKLIEIDDLVMVQLTQKNPPLMSDIDDEQNLIEQEISIISEHVGRNLKNKFISIGTDGNEQVIVNFEVIKSLESKLLTDFKQNSDRETSMFLFKSAIKHKIEQKIQSEKDMRKAEVFMRFQDMAWKQQHDNKHFIQMENPEKMSRLRITRKIDVFNVNYNSEMVKVYGHMDWAPMQVKCQNF